MKLVKFIIGWIPARVLYYTGDLVYRVMDVFADSYEYDWYVDYLYPIYNKLMLMSLDVDDWGVTGAWSPPDDPNYYE